MGLARAAIRQGEGGACFLTFFIETELLLYVRSCERKTERKPSADPNMLNNAKSTNTFISPQEVARRSIRGHNRA